MANRIQTRRGLKSKLPSSASAGEPLFSTDSHELFMGTGSSVVNMTGSHWYGGTAMNSTSTTAGACYYSACPEVKVGDYYLNTSYGYIYECVTAGSGTTARWTYKGSIRGATGGTGGTGPQGTRGTRWNTGTACTGTSTSNTQFSTGISDSIVGDMYLNTSTGYVYKCTVAGASTTAKWTYQGSIKGAQGNPGTNGNDGKDAGTYVVTTTAELNAAVTALNSTADGGKIILREGTYALSSTLITRPIIFEGMGQGVTSILHAGIFGSSASGNVGITFRDLDITLTTSSSGYDYALLTFDNCRVCDDGSHGDIFIGSGQDIYFINCRCEFASSGVLSNVISCASVMYRVNAYFSGGCVSMWLDDYQRKTLCFNGNLNMQGTVVDCDSNNASCFMCLCTNAICLDNVTLGEHAFSASISHDSISAWWNKSRITNCTIGLGAQYTYINAAVVTGNVFLVSYADYQIVLNGKTNFTNNTFTGPYPPSICGSNKVQRITGNFSQGALSVTSCDTGSVTTGNTAY